MNLFICGFINFVSLTNHLPITYVVSYSLALSFFPDHHRRGAFVHHPGMVGADELAVEALAGGAVDGVAIDLTVAIDYPTLA